MKSPHVERRLVAILAADVVGYSRLMEVDEAGTLARLKTHRLELIDPAIAKNRGRIIKTTGDGMLVEFRSVVDAVSCAAEVQRRMALRNADVSPARWIQFRIGINGNDADVAFDRFGVLHFVYYDSADRRMEYAVRNINGKWSSATPIDDRGNVGLAPNE